MRFTKWFALTLIVLLVTIVFVSTVSAQGGDAARGKVLYDRNCVLCHGDRGQGRVGATLAKDFPGIRVDALLDQIIANGVAGSVMPAWSKSKGGPLADAEIDDIVAYIRSLGHQAPTIPPTLRPPTVQAPPTLAAAASPVATFPAGNLVRGSKVYADNCVACHGDKGEGRIGALLQKDWPGINVDAFLNTTIARGVAGSKMPGWAKSYGGPLTDQEIADAASFIRTLRPPAQTTPTPAPATVPNDPGSIIGLICFGVIVLAGASVLAIGLAASRSKQQGSE